MDYEKQRGAFGMNLMCRDLYKDIEECAYNVSRNGGKLSEPVAKAFEKLCQAVKELDDVTGKEIE